MRRARGRVVSRRLRAFAATLLFALLAPVAFAQAPAEVDATMKKMLSAVQAGSLNDFVAAGDPGFRAGMTKPMFDQVSRQLSPRLRWGFTTSFLGALNQRGVAVYLWKVEFKDGGDDVLVTLAARSGKIAGFWLS